MARRLRILLIQPTWDGLSYRRKIKVNERAIHPLALGVVAALSGDHQVRIVDEARERMPDVVEGIEAVGISVNTFNAPRAYRLGDRWRGQGVPVIFGGPHTALLPEECLEHADSIVVGDAEDTWPRVLEDLAGRTLQRRYLSGNASGTAMPAPRRDLFLKSSRQVAYCQMSRGCGNRCRFCYLQYMPNAGLRLRPVGAVVNELRALRQPVILFVDDNLFCSVEYACEAFRAVVPLGKRWWIQAPADLHKDQRLIPLMARSGCYAVSIGFQTASDLNNQQERIFQNRVEEYGELVAQLHHHGIIVDGTFIFGFDGDTADTFAATGELIRRLRLDTYTFYFLTPYPGTPYFDQFEREGRILHHDWSRFDWDHVVVRPKRMSVEQLRGGVDKLYRELDRHYFLRHSLRQVPLHSRHWTCPSLISILVTTSWSYYHSPILRE